jgi:hypothetical protein
MKTRFGFVSNSSSTSFIVGLPKNYNPTDKEIKKAILDRGYAGIVNVKKIRKFLNDIKKYNCIGVFDNCNVYTVISEELFKPFIIAKIDASSDDGIIKNIFDGEATVERIKKITESYESK